MTNKLLKEVREDFDKSSDYHIDSSESLYWLHQTIGDLLIYLEEEADKDDSCEEGALDEK